EPCATALAEQQSLLPAIQNCGLITVRIRNDRRLELNGEAMGSLDDVNRLVATLNMVFAQRVEERAYRTGFELDSKVPAEDRIEKTVLIEAPRRISYGEVSDL